MGRERVLKVDVFFYYIAFDRKCIQIIFKSKSTKKNLIEISTMCDRNEYYFIALTNNKDEK